MQSRRRTANNTVSVQLSPHAEERIAFGDEDGPRTDLTRDEFVEMLAHASVPIGQDEDAIFRLIFDYITGRYVVAVTKKNDDPFLYTVKTILKESQYKSAVTHRAQRMAREQFEEYRKRSDLAHNAP